MLADHYRALGVSPNADAAAVRAAYLAVMRRCHPDLHPQHPAAQEAAQRANAAWDVLGDPMRRASYDRLLAARQPDPLLYAAPAGLRRAPPRRADVAHSPEGERCRRAFHRASLRAALTIMALASLLLVGLTLR